MAKAKAKAAATAAGTSPPAPGVVLVYSHSWLPGQVDGVAVRMMGHVKELVRRGTKVVLVTPNFIPPSKEGKMVAPELQSLSDVKRHVALDSTLTPVYQKNLCMRLSIKNLRTLVQVIREEKPEYIHATQEANLLTLIAASILCDVPLIISMHTDVVQIANADAGFAAGSGSGLYGRLHTKVGVFFVNFGYWLWSLAAPKFFCVSDQAKVMLRAGIQPFGWGRVPEIQINEACWGPAVDRRQFRVDLPADEVAACRKRLSFGIDGAYVMVYVGRVTAEKDIQFLVDALQRAPKNVVLALIGPGSMTEELKKIHGPQHRVYCTGGFAAREEVALCMRASDCSVSASTMETVGFTALEALSCGTPFLAARAQGFALHLQHGVNARLWTPYDAESFDRELATLMSTKREGCWSPEALRATMETASVEVCTDRALNCYLAAGKVDMRLLRLVAIFFWFFMNSIVAGIIG